MSESDERRLLEEDSPSDPETIEQWLQMFREIWHSPEDMRARLHDAFQRFFDRETCVSCDESCPDSAVASRANERADVRADERVRRLTFLCVEQQRVHPFVAEVVKYFETLVESTEDSTSDFSINDSHSRSQMFLCLSRIPNGYEIGPKTTSAFRFRDYVDELKPEIDQLLTKRDQPSELVSAVRMIVFLSLQASYDLAYVLAPLIMSDQNQLVDSFVGDDVERQKCLVSLFDRWAAMRPHQFTDDLRFMGIDLANKGYKFSKFNQRSLGRMTTNLVKKYGLNEDEACPLLLEYRERGFLRHQTKEFIVGQAVDEQTWADNVESVVRRRPNVAPAIVDILCEFRDYHRAAKWAKKLELENVPPAVANRMRQLPAGPVTFGEEGGVRGRTSLDGSISGNDVYHPFALPFSSIVMVDTAEKYDTFLDDLSRMIAGSPAKSIRVGVDAEWPPQQTNLGHSRVALLQIAVATKVFLLDVLALSMVLSAERWVEGLGQRFIANPDVCKLGYGLHDDFRTLLHTVTALKDAGIVANNIFELRRVCDNLFRKAPRLFSSGKDIVADVNANGCDNEVGPTQHPSPSRRQQQPQHQRRWSNSSNHSNDQQQQQQRYSQNSPSPASISPDRKPQTSVISNSPTAPQKIHGLSALVQALLGKPLDKRPQCSDWDRRPLRESQMVYAALDAHVLIQIYDEIVARVKTAGLQDQVKLDDMDEMELRAEEREEKEERKKIKKEKQLEKTKEKRKMRGIKAAVQSQQFAQEMKNITLTLDESRPIIPPKSLRVVCDNMLQGLGRQLRLCGVDVRILTNDEDHDVAARVGVDEDRIVLTCGKTFDRLKKLVPTGNCVFVETKQAKRQCVEVLQHFNVRVEPSDIFSRCQLCNCDKWTVVPCAIVFRLWDNLVEEQDRRRGRIENWGKPMGKSNWSPVKEIDTKVANSGEIEEGEEGQKRNNEDSLGQNAGTGLGKEASAESPRELSERAALLGISLEDGIFRSPMTNQTVQLDLAVIPQVVFDNVKNFYLCSSCGKIYWDGSHYERTNNIYAEVLGFDVNSAVEGLKIDD